MKRLRRDVLLVFCWIAIFGNVGVWVAGVALAATQPDAIITGVLFCITAASSFISAVALRRTLTLCQILLVAFVLSANVRAAEPTDAEFDFATASKDVPKPRAIWPIVRQHMLPPDFTIHADEIVVSDTDPTKRLRKVTAHFWSQQISGRKWGHQCVIFLPQDASRTVAPDRRGKVVIIGSPPDDYFPVHVEKYGEPIAARLGYPTMVLSNPGEYKDGSPIDATLAAWPGCSERRAKLTTT